VIRSPRWWCRLCPERGVGGPDGWKEHAHRAHSGSSSLSSNTQVKTSMWTHNGRYVYQRAPMAFGFAPPSDTA
jgi:hypothetical protein